MAPPTATVPATGPRTPEPAPGRLPGQVFSGGFTLFADMLLLGVLTALASLPAVTAPAAFGAAASLLRRAGMEGAPVRFSDFPAELRTHLTPASALGGLLLPALAAVIVVDAALIHRGLPGAAAVAPALALCVLGAAAVALRAGALGPAGRGTASASVRRSAADPRGTVLLCAAAVVAALIAWAIPLLVPLLPGPLALAAAAVEPHPHD